MSATLRILGESDNPTSLQNENTERWPMSFLSEDSYATSKNIAHIEPKISLHPVSGHDLDGPQCGLWTLALLLWFGGGPGQLRGRFHAAGWCERLDAISDLGIFISCLLTGAQGRKGMKDLEIWGFKMFVVSLCMYITEGSLEVQLPTICWKAEQRSRVRRQKIQVRESQKKEDTVGQNVRKVADRCVFPMIVAHSTFPSQNVQNTPGSDHFFKLGCWKIARRCGMLGPLFEVQMPKN